MKKKVLITGSNGQLGTDLKLYLKNLGYEAYGYSKDELDVIDLENVQEVFKKIQPSIVIHCAAYTKVDQAESEPDIAFLINSIGTRNIAIEAEKNNSKLVYVSTDYVFNGEGINPYNEFEPTSPLGIYGKSKLAGEEFVKSLSSKYFIVRTSWVFGAHGNNFVKTMLNLAKSRDTLSVVSDQVGCPTYTVDLAKHIELLISTEKYGVYHISNSGHCSWFEFAVAIFEETKQNIIVNPIKTEEFPRPARRPAYSVFDHMALRLNGFPKVRNWRDALKEFIIENNY